VGETIVQILRPSPRRAPAVALAALAALCCSSCGDVVREGKSASFLVIDRLEGARGGGSNQNWGTVLASDVRTNGGVYEDMGRVALRLAPKDVTGNPLSTNNDVTINRYRVTFYRSDGRNQQGVDVPYAFDGAATFTVSEAGSTAGFILVRQQSKLEPPLIQLVGLGGALTISTLADVTFYGRDQVGNEVTVTGTIGVNFADWADPK
jgi:hypothetical protein